MKKIAILILVIVALVFFMTSVLFSDSRSDIQTIKKAVKQNPAYQSGKEAKLFKVLITDNVTKKEKVNITLPVSVIEAFVKCTDSKRLKVRGDECDIDLKELFQELKKLGPTSLIELYEDETTIKVWLE